MTNLIAIDTETSDLDPARGAQLLEVALAPLDTTATGYEIAEDGCGWFIEHTRPIPSQAKAVHHITESMVAPGAPGVKNRDSVVNALVALEAGAGAWIAHNAAFDRRFLPELTRPWICTYRAALHLYPKAPSHGLQALRYELGLHIPVHMLEGVVPHRARYDAVCCAALAAHMLKENTAEHLLELSGRPVLLHRCRFGRYRNLDWSEVPVDYCRWILRDGKFDDDVLYTARHWVAQHERTKAPVLAR